VADGANEISNAALELKLFMMLDQLPLANITSFIAIILVLVFL
jgi:BCCT family betaine/carnitine transporter